MPRVRIVIEDDNGNPLPSSEQTYVLDSACDTLNQIESSIETFRKSALPALEQSLLSEAQERYVTTEKKRVVSP